MKDKLEKIKVNLKCVVMSDNNFTGKALFSAPSGAGKTTCKIIASQQPVCFYITVVDERK